MHNYKKLGLLNTFAIIITATIYTSRQRCKWYYVIDASVLIYRRLESYPDKMSYNLLLSLFDKKIETHLRD